MKIGIEIQRLFRKKKYGIETSSLELIKKMQALDPKFEFVVFAKNDEDRACFTESEKFKVKTLGGDFFADFEQLFCRWLPDLKNLTCFIVRVTLRPISVQCQ